MREQNEQAAIDAGEESTPRLANKEFFTGTDMFVDDKEHTLFTLLVFNGDASSVLHQSDINGTKGPIVMESQDPEGPSLDSLIDGIRAHIHAVAFMSGGTPYSEETIRVIAEDISANY